MLRILLAGALMLPDHVGGPGGGRVAVGAGVEGRAPVVDVRWGIVDALAVSFEGLWNEEAPRLGVGLRGATGRSGSELFALAWAEGHLRPVLTTDVARSISGGDVGGGLGVVVQGDWASAGLEGGLAVGLPAQDGRVPGVDATQIDQRSGLFGVQRAFLAADLGDHLELALLAAFAVPVGSVSFRRESEDVVGRWDVRLGGRALARF